MKNTTPSGNAGKLNEQDIKLLENNNLIDLVGGGVIHY